MNHDLLHVLSAFYNIKVGSGSFYEKVFHKLIERRQNLRPAEFIKLFNILPKMQYIYENNMNEQLWNDYLECVSKQIYKKTLPVEELCQVFNTFINLNYSKGHSKLFYHMVNQLRGSVFQIPAEHFTMTMFSLLEAQITDVGMKFKPIIEKLSESGQVFQTFPNKQDQIRLLWSLLVLEQAQSTLKPDDITQILSNIEMSKLDPMHFKLLIQTLNLSLAVPEYQTLINYEFFYNQLGTLSDEFKQEILNHDFSAKTSDEIRVEIKQDLDALLNDELKEEPKEGEETTDWEVYNNFIDDFLNCIDVVALKANKSTQVVNKIAVVLNNEWKYLKYSLDKDHEPKLRKTEELKLLILQNLYEWQVINVDEDASTELTEAIKNNVENDKN